jgi:hypothetical protein
MIYSTTHKLRLVICTVNAGQLQDFSTYFTIHPSAAKSILLSDSMRLLTEKRDVYPRGLPDDLESISPVWNPETRTHIGSTTGIELTFEDKDYPQSILFYEQCGGGPGWPALERLQFTPKTWQSVQQRLQLLPKRYNAIHVRNRDYSTDWQDFIGSIPAHDLRRLPCLLCTDDPRVVQGQRGFSRILTFIQCLVFPLILQKLSYCTTPPKREAVDLISACWLFLLPWRIPSNFSLPGTTRTTSLASACWQWICTVAPSSGQAHALRLGQAEP